MRVTIRTGTIFLFTCLLLVAVYLPLITKGSFQFNEIPGFPNYDMLASAFLSKQLHLKQEVDPRRLQAQNPLDPSHPSPFQFDTVIWKGKYYLQHEPFPALLHTAWTALTFRPCTTGVMILLSVSGVLIIHTLLLMNLRRWYFKNSPPWIFWGIWTSFSLSSVQLYMVSWPAIYHEAIALGSLLSLSGIFFMMITLHSDNGRTGLLALAGSCFGAAVCCRASLIFYPVSLIATIVVFRLFQKKSYIDIFKLFLPLFLSLGIFILFLFSYNFLKFENPINFGRNYVMFSSYEDFHYSIMERNTFRLKHVPIQLYLYLVSLPNISDTFPFLQIPYETRIRLGDALIVSQRVCSIFILMPMLIMILPTPFFQRYRKTKDNLSLLILYFIVASASVFALLTFYHYATVRYFYDFAPILFVIAFCNFCVYWDRIQGNPKKERIAQAVFACLIFATILSGLLVGYMKMRS